LLLLLVLWRMNLSTELNVFIHFCCCLISLSAAVASCSNMSHAAGSCRVLRMRIATY
jgi:hypothetical protein